LGNALEHLDMATMTMLFTLPHSALAAGQMIVDAVSARAPDRAARTIC
jgi:Cu/Ag efflux protein CusF